MASKTITITVGLTFVVLLALLLNVSGTVLSTQGDVSCQSKCNISFNFTSSNYTIYVKNPNNFQLTFSPAIKNYIVYKRYSSTSNKWIPVDITNVTFTKGTKYQFKAEVTRNSPIGNIKYAVGIADKYIDPYLIGINITGNTESINDSNAYLSATPHTITDSGFVYFNLSIKSYSGNIDIYYGYDSDNAKPKSAELFSPHNDSVQKSYTCDSPNWFNYTTSPKHFYCWNNYSYLTATDNITYTWNNGTTLVFDHSFTSANLSINTAYWNERVYSEYSDISRIFTKINYNYSGMDTWYYKTNIPIIANQMYSIRVWHDVTFNTNGKYIFAVKPSSESINTAIANGHMSFLDPWYNASWSFVRPITITNSSALVDYQMNILLNSTYIPNLNWSNNGNDLRFTYADNTTSIPCWIESWTNLSTSNASVWCRTNQTNPNMWYGNPTATSQSNKNGMFNETFFTPFNVGNLTDIIGGFIGTNQGSVSIAGHRSDARNFTAASSQYIDYGDDNSTEGFTTFSVQAWIKPASINPGSNWIAAKHGGAPPINGWTLGYCDDNCTSTNSVGQVYGYMGWTDGTNTQLNGSTILASNTWYHLAMTYNSTDNPNKVCIFVNSVKDRCSTNNAASKTMRNNNASLIVGSQTGYSYFDGVIDEVRISSNPNNIYYMNTEPTVSIGAEQTADTTPPTITITSPLNQSYNPAQNWVWANVTLNELGSWCGVSLNGTSNQSLTNSSGNWNLNVSVPTWGANNVKFYCNGTFGNMNTTTPIVYFTTVPHTITLYLNGTSSDIFKELGEALNATACSNVVGTTVYLSSSYPQIGGGLNGTTINGTTCATYLWNNTQVVMNQFNNSATSQNHSANNISGITINSVTDLQGGSMYFKGYYNETYVNYVNTLGLGSYSSINLTDNYKAFDGDVATYATNSNWYLKGGNPVTSTTTLKNITLTNDYVNNITFYFRHSGNTTITTYANTTFYLYNQTSGIYDLVYTWSNYAMTGGTWYEKGITGTNADIIGYVKNNILAYKWNTTVTSYTSYVLEVWDNISYTTNNYPSNISIDIGNDGILDYWLPYMTLQDTYAITNKFKTNVATKNLIFSRGGTNVTYIQAPCNSQAKALSWNVGGGNGTQTLTKVDSTYDSRSYALSTNGSQLFNLYFPPQSTVSSANISLSGSAIYTAKGTQLNGGMIDYSGYRPPSCSGYVSALSEGFSGTVTLTSSVESRDGSSWCGDVDGLQVILSLKGESSGLTHAWCYATIPNSICPNYVTGYGGVSCTATVSGTQAGENLYVTTAMYETFTRLDPTRKEAGNATCTGYLSGLAQYTQDNPSNVTIWYNNSIQQYNFTSTLNTSQGLQNITLSTTNINNYLASSGCTANPCPVPFYIKVNNKGNVNVSNAYAPYIASISNITFDVANDGIIDGNISGSTIPNNQIVVGTPGLISTNNYIQSHCVNNSVSVPIVTTSATAGTMSLSNLVGNFSINPINLNMSAMIHNVTGNNQVPIKYTADNWGILNTYGLSINALTDYNYTFTGWAANSLSNMTKMVKLIWSNFSLSFPQNWIDYPEFFPSTNSSQNVTPIEQSNTTPIFNLTYLARAQPMNISVYLNTSIDSCANITISPNMNKSSGRILNTTISYDWITNFSSGTAGLWAFVDLNNCNPNTARYLTPDFTFQSRCLSC